SLRIHIEQRIAAMMGYRGGSGGCFEMKGLEDDEEGLYDELHKLETSFDVLEGCLCATAWKRKKKGHVPILVAKI
ncbi:hypothetical protein Tco_0854583, partial [Tanacetum coccineum]